MTGLPPSIEAAMEDQGGLVTFARFMELALTDPRAGYYTQPERTLGPSGDFTTAPRKVPAFNRALARFMAELLDALHAARIDAGGDPPRSLAVYEVGPGEGDMAAGVLAVWDTERPDLRDRVTYRLVEVGVGLRRRQEEALAAAGGEGWSLAWLAGLPRSSAGDPGGDASPPGMVITNELLDALPVHRLDVRGDGVLEAWVGLGRPASRERAEGVASPEERWLPPSAEAMAEVDLLFGTRDTAVLRTYSQDGLLEVRPALGPFVSSAAEAVGEGFLITIDYGEWLSGPEVPGVAFERIFPHRESLRCYYRHQRRHSPYDLVGRQDITADVDFRALALHGARAGFECLLFTGLGPLLRAMGAGDELERLRAEARTSLDRDIEAGALAALLEDGGLGDTFKVMVQVRETECDVAS